MMYREDAKDAVRYEKPTEEEIEYIGRDTIYAYLARERERLFPNEMFEDLYASGGRPSVPRSIAIRRLFCLFCVFILVFWLRLLPCFRVLARCRRLIISSLPATTI